MTAPGGAPPRNDDLASYHVGWQDDQEPEDPLASYTPDWRQKTAGAPVDRLGLVRRAEEVAPPAVPASAVPPTRFPENQPRYNRFGEPLNEAAQEVEAAAPVRAGQFTGPTETATPRTVALRYGLDVARGTLNMLTLLPQAVRAVFSDLTPEEARNPATLTAALRYGPHAVEYVRQVAAQPTSAERGAGPAAPAAFLSGLNPLPLLGEHGLGSQHPYEVTSALGELGGMVIGGKALGEAVPLEQDDTEPAFLESTMPSVDVVPDARAA